MLGNASPAVLLTWPTPNYVDPVTQGPAAWILCLVFGLLMFAAVAARFYVRLAITRSFGLDDWLLVVALVPTIGLLAGIVAGVTKYQFDRHSWDVKPDMWIAEAKLTVALQWLYILATAFTKFSILALYRRLVGRSHSPIFVASIYATAVFVLAFVITFTVTNFIGCTPFGAFWMQYSASWRLTHSFHCIDDSAVVVSALAISSFQDFLIALLPISFVYKLHISTKQKIAICSLFAVAILTCITSVVRILFVVKSYSGSYDIGWQGYIQWCFTAAEVTSVIICACGPALKVYFKKDGTSEVGSTSRTSERSDQTKVAASSRAGLAKSDSSASETDMELLKMSTANTTRRHTMELDEDRYEV